jgi:hypothetical protein
LLSTGVAVTIVVLAVGAGDDAAGAEHATVTDKITVNAAI